MGNVLLFPIRVASAVREKGVHYWLVYWYCYLCLTFAQRSRKTRLHKYNQLAHGDPETQGFYIPRDEERVEWPKTQIKNKECDSIYIFGLNSKSECLSVRLTHVSDTEVWCSLYLRLENGKVYCLPEEHLSQIRTDEPDTFGSSRLKMQCILPMRKWRIFFNGMLREVNSEGEASTLNLRHVRIAMLYTPSGGAFDFVDNMSNEFLSDTVANCMPIWGVSPKTVFESISKQINGYEHPGMMQGTFMIDNDSEQELYLWGSRGHYLGDLKTETSSKAIEFPWKCSAQLENGTFIQIGETDVNAGSLSRMSYGYVMRQNGFLYPINYCHVEYRSSDELRINCKFGGYKYYITADIKKNPFGGFDSQISSSVQNFRQMDVSANGVKGKGILYLGREIRKGTAVCSKGLPKDFPSTNELSTPLREPANGNSALTGGKGSSLYHLYSIQQGYTVPNGVIVTTNGYEQFINKDLRKLIKELQDISPFLTSQDLTIKCERTIAAIKEASIPDSLRNSVSKNLQSVFKNKVNEIKFAVRSSATGEDTEQMSAAGQMDTFLGVQGIEKILEAVKKCWASQFAFVAVQYKRQYGQELNSPMAVVIQEMVPCDVAGVAFSCDPLTGNPTFPSITANYGLGESVVSAAAEPDTIVLKRDLNDAISIHDRQIGSKKIKIMMDETSGVKEIDLNENESGTCSINDQMAERLGKIVATLEKKYGNPRDIEWGIKDDKIFLFQCRPVTSLDTDTDYEIRHLGDSFIRTEKEYLSTANVGEVMPGATSPLGLDMMTKNHCYIMAKHTIVRWEGEQMPDSPYYAKRIAVVNNHVLFCVLDAFFRFEESDEDGNSDATNAITIAIFGRIIDDPQLVAMSKDRHSTSHTVESWGHFFESIVAKAYVFTLLFFGGRFAQNAAEKVDKIELKVKKNSSSMEVLDYIANNYYRLYPTFVAHMDVTFSSPLWNHAVMSILVKENGAWDNKVYSDFAYLVSTLSDVESADVPAAIQALSFAISKAVDKKEFSNMSVENALNWLKSAPSDVGKIFRQFLETHGHRCLKEFDMQSKPWGTDPKPLVKMLQKNVTQDFKDLAEKKSPSYSEIFSKMSIKVGFFNRILLRIFLPFCQKGVRDREITKSLLIKSFDKLRKLTRHLSETMVAEGRLPFGDLLYFLSVPEIRKLIETRSPRIVTRAFRRWKCQPELDQLIFPELACGIPKPVNMEEEIEAEDGFTMKGVPVSRGVVKATARVVMNIEDAKNIQPGDVLITYSTDIGWSPYFPLLSGVVTELGGLISHGAVVAREYGLPCVVNLHGATRAFKSGDLVMLNGTEGFLKKIKSAS